MARTTKAEDLREQDLMLAHGDLSDALGELAQIYLRYPVLMQFTNAIEMKLKAAQARIRSELDRARRPAVNASNLRAGAIDDRHRLRSNHGTGSGA
jgi:hypothetical protein